MNVSVIIPAYNEENRIPNTLASIDSFLKDKNYDYEIIVVNDGSSDKTVKVVDELKPKIKNLRLIDNKTNKGKGYAVRKGLASSNFKYRLFTDADNATPINHLDDLISHAEDHHVLVGSRFLKESEIVNAQPLHRKALGRFYKFMVNSFVGLSDISDTQCGFKMFSAESCHKILPKCKVNGFSFDAELLAVAKKAGYKVKELPVKWIDNKDSKVKFKKMAKAIFEIFQIRWNLLTGRYES